MARDVGLAIAMLVEAFNVQSITPVRIKIYERALAKLPPALLEPTVLRAIETRTSKVKDWLPSVEELMADAETVRLEMRAALKFEPCAMCSKDGWTEVERDGVRRMERCRCWKAHQAKVAALDVGSAPLSLSPAESKDWTEVGSLE